MGTLEGNNGVEERGADIKERAIQMHESGMSARQIARETKVPPSTIWGWINQSNEVKQIGEILEEIAKRYGKQAFSNRNIKREYASRSPDTVVRWLNELAETGKIVNGYRVERIYQGDLYGEPYQDFLLIEV